MELILLLTLVPLQLIVIILLLIRKSGTSPLNELQKQLDSIESGIKQIRESLHEEVRSNRTELAEQMKCNRAEMAVSFKDFRTEVTGLLRTIADQNLQALDKMRDSNIKALKEFSESFEKNVKTFNDLQREKFAALELKQNELVTGTEKKLEQMRLTVEEKLEKTLSERLGQSFETVGKQLLAVQAGLGEMKTLASDVGDLKKVLSNVKQRGGVGEIQLEMLLEQVLAPEQYEANVKTKKGSADQVEFAIRLPGRDDRQECVYLPVDAKFPKDAYEHLVDAYEKGDPDIITRMNTQFENAIRKMAKDIRDKYLDPPNTTDFGIMFLPFEGIYAEAVRRSSLLEQLQREFKVIITGPTTLAAILNSLQMGFRTLALQKRSSEVWEVLGAVKTEFGKFGDMLEKAQKNIQTANNQLDEVIGKRTKAIQRKLRGVEALDDGRAGLILPEVQKEYLEEETELN